MNIVAMIFFKVVFENTQYLNQQFYEIVHNCLDIQMQILAKIWQGQMKSAKSEILRQHFSSLKKPSIVK